jgi:hypothetical protein
MARSISSAEPEKLFAYADSGVRIDHDLISKASKLASRLQHFEATCTEPGYRVSASHLAGELRGHGSQSETIDSWVRQVGKGFQAADQIWIGVPRTELPIWQLRIPLPGVHPFPMVGVPIRIRPVLPSIWQVPGWLVGILLAWIEAILGKGVNTDDEPQLPPVRRRHLQQNSPEGDKDILKLKRVQKNGKPELDIVTVRDHIARFGCLMTSYTMLLQDRDIDVEVTDLYKAKYELANSVTDFDTDAADGTISLDDLFTPPSVATNAAQTAGASEYKAYEGNLSGTTDEERRESLQEQIDKYDSVIVHVTGDDRQHGHWIVVDGYNADGSFNVRNPLKEDSEDNVAFGSSGESDYKFFDRQFKYVEKVEAGGQAI